MNTRPYLTWLMLLLAVRLSAQQLAFNRLYNHQRYDDARGVVATPDGGLVFTGLNKSGPDSLGDMYLSKINAAGATIWTRFYGREKEDGGNALVLVSDGGFLISGHTALSYGLACDGYVVKTNAEGREEWRALIGTAYDDVCSGVAELPDGSFLMTGRIEDPQSRQFGVMLTRLSAKGKQTFMKTLAINQPAIGLDLALASDGNVLISGFTWSDDPKQADMLVLKCTPDGNLLWYTTFNADGNDRAVAVTALGDGACAVVGGSTDGQDQFVRAVALRYDAGGHLLAASEGIGLSTPAYLSDVVVDPSDRLVVCGMQFNPESGLNEPFGGILDESLAVQSVVTGDYQSNCRTRCMALDGAGNLIFGGNVESAVQYGVFMTKISMVTSNVQWVNEAPVLLFPNPFSEMTYLKIGYPGVRKHLYIHDLSGRLMRQMDFDTEELFVPRDGLAAGRYAWKVTDEGGRVVSILNVVVWQ